MIDSIYNSNGDFYFPKSRVFLYPLLEMRRDNSVRPLNTYVAWKDNIVREDRWLICTFYLRNDVEYKAYEKRVLLGNPMFQDFKESDDGIGMYIFSFKKYAADWDNFLQGKYSKFSSATKDKIKKNYPGNSVDAVYIDSFLNPKKYYPIYARLLNVHISTLEGGELCDMPDFNKETLKMSLKDNSVKNNSLDLPKS